VAGQQRLLRLLPKSRQIALIMIKNSNTPRGIIEGFFGRSWSWEERASYTQFLALNGYDFYIYAPKGDENLRMQWQRDWEASEKRKLQHLRKIYRDAAIEFGIGLSPHEIYLHSQQDQRPQLARRIQQINELEPDILCILFDDMRGDIPNLAQLQIDIAHQAAEISNARKIIFCPTYYSFDPILEKVFGAMPVNYWQTFARQLDGSIDMFWTGEKVCSTAYSEAHLANISELIGRKPFLWDNYPVNDGAVKSNLLHLRAFDKSHSQLTDKIAGHAVNPMNQAQLSKLALASLNHAYEKKNNYDPAQSFVDISLALCGERLGQQLQDDIHALQDLGLQKLSNAEKNTLRNTYQQFLPNPFAQEILDWLNGVYTFDPACLTE